MASNMSKLVQGLNGKVVEGNAPLSVKTGLASLEGEFGSPTSDAQAMLAAGLPTGDAREQELKERSNATVCLKCGGLSDWLAASQQANDGSTSDSKLADIAASLFGGESKVKKVESFARMDECQWCGASEVYTRSELVKAGQGKA